MILLTGRDGQLGRALHPVLSRFGPVTATSRGDLDLAESGAVARAFRELDPDLVVNAAAYTAVDAAESETELAMAVNGAAVAALADACAARGAAMVHFSTDYVFDGIKDTPYTESDPTGPLNAYGRSKLAGEVALAASGASHLIVRTSWIYDAKGGNFLTTILRLGAERTRLSVVDDQRGAPTSADALARAVGEILSRAGGSIPEFLQRRGGLCHMACRGQTTWHGFAEAILDEARLRGRQLTVTSVEAIGSAQFGAAAARPCNSILALDRLKKMYGVELPNWRQALASEFDKFSN